MRQRNMFKPKNMSEEPDQKNKEEKAEKAKIFTKVYNPNVNINLPKAKTHHEVDINGVKVVFPFKPYKIQNDYMKAVIKA